jgi:2-keto-4-pentenoate hydratase/2-oxohepta-3-ene-1,7-dioic acid hydratase in catechol pathway
MRLAMWRRDGDDILGVVETDGWYELERGPDQPASVQQILSDLDYWGPRIREQIASATKNPGEPPYAWLPPVGNPSKILCVGLNYADHAKETGASVPDRPVIFNKLATTLSAHGRPIVLPPESSKVDYEAELVVVIGKKGRRIAEADAMSHVAGYACGNDVSARDWQKETPGGQWLLGKSFDGFAPLGPYVVTADAIPDPGKLKIQFRLDGETLQDSSTDQLLFSIPRVICYISQVCTLLPGDLIYTGTPAGVGVARTPRRYLQPGQVAEVEIEGLGVLRNPVVADGEG